ncbi:hypothetical protein F5Y08DRAFT_352624 [Xylaria arbuscula]|nr:hypothetical protein F5Y08DRAFT_352624 [Xylaria arbuscula]
MKIGNARTPLTEFHLFPELAVELRLMIWECAADTDPIPICVDAVYRAYWGAGLDELGLIPHLDHDGRMETLRPLLNACYESREAIRKQYSFTSITDLIFYDRPTDLLPDYQDTQLAIDWRRDILTMTYPDREISDDLPDIFEGMECFPEFICWSNQLCKATKLCLTLDARYFEDVEEEVERSRSEMEKITESWINAILPQLPKLKEITFVISDGDKNFLDALNWGCPQCSEEKSGVPYTPCPNLSIPRSRLTDLVYGPMLMNDYPMSSPSGELHWWEPILDSSSYIARLLQSKTEKKRPRMKFRWAFDSCLVGHWENGWEAQASIRDNKLRFWNSGRLDWSTTKPCKLFQFITRLRWGQHFHDSVTDDRFQYLCERIHAQVLKIIEPPGPTTGKCLCGELEPEPVVK